VLRQRKRLPTSSWNRSYVQEQLHLHHKVRLIKSIT
jgi:hypothetical protein